MVQVGVLIDGRYRVLREIGKGGSGIVYLVLHEQAGQLRAMKVMRADGDQRTLQEELRILRSLKHRMLPEILDVIMCGDSCCLILQYFEGETLEQTARRRKISLQEALHWGSQLCEVMQYLHSRPVPVYYFDLKPSNIILDDKGQLFLVDFGSARSVYAGRRTGEDLAQTGTPGYAAPELYEEEIQCGSRADIYSIGAVLYYLLNGKKPRGGETKQQCCEAFCAAGAEDAHLSKKMSETISNCLSIEPARRFPDCKKLQQRLDHMSGEGRLLSLKKSVGEGLHLLAGASSTVCLCASMLCFSASAGMRSRVFDSDLQRSLLASGTEKWHLLEEAASLFPERGEPYLELIDAVIQDGVFSEEESTQLTGLLYRRSIGSGEDNISHLRSDADAYLLVSYRLGLAYYFLAGESGDKTAAAGWLSQAADGENVSHCADSAQAEEICRDARVLLDLCEYYNMRLTLSGGRQETDPAGLWKMLGNLLQAGEGEEEASKWILREWLQIFYDNMDLLRHGIGEEEICKALEMVKKRLPASSEADSRDKEKQEIIAFYECVLADWNVLRSEELLEGE